MEAQAYVAVSYGNFKRELQQFISQRDDGEVISVEEIKKFFEGLKQKQEGTLNQYMNYKKN